MSSTWPPISYFHEGTAAARHIMAQLEFLERADWVELYLRKHDDTLWRLDTYDKFQQRYLVRIDDRSKWQDFDASGLEKGLLFESRGGLSKELCLWNGCSAAALKSSAFCLDHTYAQGVRK